VATSYVSFRDKRGIHLKLGDTARFFDGERRVVGWVENLSEGKVTLRYPQTLVPVSSDGGPTPERAAPDSPKWARRTLPAAEVERWG